jgi:hypothetical protein
MSAAANAAGYLYTQGQLAVSDPNAQVEAASSPKRFPSRAQSKPVEPVRTPRIEYRRRRVYTLPSAARAE